MSGVDRQPAGTPKGGQFATGAKAEPVLSLTAHDNGGPDQLVLGAGVSPEHAGLPAVRPADWDPFAAATDRLIQSVHDGPLSRGVVDGHRTRSMRSWHRWAQTQARTHAVHDPELAEAYDEFMKGMEHAVIALMSDKAEVAPDYVVSKVMWELGSHPRLGDYAKARRLLSSKRTSKASRAEWARMAHESPSEPARRGYLTAAAALSGTDAWWGLRDDPKVTVGLQ